MTDEVANGQKTKGLGKLSISKLGKVKAWQAYEKASKASTEADAVLQAAKKEMRVYLKGVLSLGEDVALDFSRDRDGTLNIYQRLEPRKSKRPATGLLDDLIK